MNFENWRVKFKRVKIKRSWKLEVHVRWLGQACDVGEKKKKTKWEEPSIRPACEKKKKTEKKKRKEKKSVYEN